MASLNVVLVVTDCGGWGSGKAVMLMMIFVVVMAIMVDLQAVVAEVMC